MRRGLLFILTLLITVGIQAQNTTPGAAVVQPVKYRVLGRVVDGNSNSPLDYATVSVLNQSDSSIITGVVTDAEGKFNIELDKGSYIVQVQFISYKSKNFNVNLTTEKPRVNLGDIKLMPDTETLEEVVVTGKKSQMTMELDKRVFNVGQDLSNIGASAQDVLDNIPSVTVDIEGNVSLRGSQNVRILVNGKPSGLVGLSDASGLRNLQSNLIERVEVVTNPSARYEARGNAGIINIILKKDEQQGLNGTFNANVGVPHNHGAGFNLNYRRSWLNLFATYGLSYRKSPGFGFSNQTFLREDTTFYRDVSSDRSREELSNTFRLGADIFLDDKNTITFSGLYQKEGGLNTTNILYQDFDANRDLVSESLRYDDEIEDEQDIEFNLNYSRQFGDDEDHKLTADIQYRENSETEDADQEQGPVVPNSEDFEPDILQRSLNNEFQNNLLLQTDYVRPFSENGKFEVGYRGSLRTIDNSYIVEEQNDEGEWENLEGFTNDFLYDENIQAGYMMYGNKWGNISFQGGLRVEMTDITTDLQQTGERNDKNYTNFFPSAHFTYELANENNIQVSYSRRIDRPGFWDLNPFSSFTDPLNIRTGNPDLDPEFSDSYEMGYLKNWPTATLYTSVYYRHSTGVIDRIRYVEVEQGDSITYSIPQNLSSRDAVGVEFTFSKDVGDWWRLNGTANFYHQRTEGEFRGQDLSNEALTMSTRVTSQMTIWDEVETQVSFRYRAPQNDTQGRRKSFYTIDIGVSKDIFRGKGTLIFNVRDLLNSRIRRGETVTEGFRQYSEFQWRARQATLTLNYRLNQNKKPNRGGEGRGDWDGGDDF